MKPLLALAATLALAACGTDGAPTPPVAKSGLSVTGDVQIGAKR